MQNNWSINAENIWYMLCNAMQFCNKIFFFNRYLKAAKEVQQRNEKLTDEQCNALLQNALELSTEIWLPEK